uniref:Uncharacterized protein n=1 Tax=Anguilla anguilla TaxID=7936 RepID=A0A0E9SYU3_ANGAN
MSMVLRPARVFFQVSFATNSR